MNREQRRKMTKTTKKKFKDFKNNHGLNDPKDARDFLKNMKLGVISEMEDSLHERIDQLSDEEVHDLINSVLKI